MSRPPLEVADVIRAAPDSFFDRGRHWFSWLHLKVLNAILACRTWALGGHVDECSRCGHRTISFNSCRNRHCPKCQANARDRWLAARRHPCHLGAEIGFFAVLHTWNQQLLHHPHLHCVVPAGGLSPDHNRWIHAPPGFFLPVKVLSRVFRGKFVAGLRQLHRDGQLTLSGKLSHLQAPQAFAAWLRPLYRSDWVVYSKRPLRWPRVCPSLSRRPAPIALKISNHRLVALTDGKVTFRWRDSGS